MDKFEKVIDGLKRIQGYLECTKGCPYYNENCANGDCRVISEAIELIALRKEINQMNVTTQQAVTHLMDSGWLKMYEEFVLMKKRLGLIKPEEEYQYENWH